MSVAPPLHLFEYDARSALRVSELAREEREGVVVEEIRYDNGAGGAADAYVVTPDGDPPARGVVLAHGGADPGKHLFLNEATELARRRFTVLAADISRPPPGDVVADERAIAAAVCTQRRGLDVLAARGVADFGFFGHSFGGEEGAILAAVEPRLAAIVIAACGSGLVEWLRRRGFEDEEYLAAVDRYDPIHYVGVPGSRRLLFQYGRRDEVFSHEEARALFDAAAEPKRWEEYDWGHGLDGDLRARADRFAFFEAELRG